jgi:hypothetical protein
VRPRSAVSSSRNRSSKRALAPQAAAGSEARRLTARRISSCQAQTQSTLRGAAADGSTDRMLVRRLLGASAKNRRVLTRKGETKPIRSAPRKRTRAGGEPVEPTPRSVNPKARITRASISRTRAEPPPPGHPLKPGTQSAPESRGTRTDGAEGRPPARAGTSTPRNLSATLDAGRCPPGGDESRVERRLRLAAVEAAEGAARDQPRFEQCSARQAAQGRLPIVPFCVGCANPGRHRHDLGEAAPCGARPSERWFWSSGSTARAHRLSFPRVEGPRLTRSPRGPLGAPIPSPLQIGRIQYAAEFLYPTPSRWVSKADGSCRRDRSTPAHGAVRVARLRSSLPPRGMCVCSLRDAYDVNRMAFYGGVVSQTHATGNDDGTVDSERQMLSNAFAAIARESYKRWQVDDTGIGIP